MQKFLNQLVKYYIKRWDHEVNAFSTSPIAVQNRELSRILASPYFKYLNNLTKESDAHFYKDMPISQYYLYKDRIMQLKSTEDLVCEYYARSSGTGIGIRKLIPTPERFVKMNHLRGSWYTLHTLYTHNPQMTVFGRRNLLVGGSIYEQHAKYLIADVSGIMLYRIPLYMRPSYLPDIATAVQADWEVKIDRTARAAAIHRDVSLIGGVPTWVLAVLKNTLQYSGVDRLSELWPQASCYIHGGVSFEPYRKEFEEHFTQEGFRYLEIYNATEGFFAYQDRPTEPGMLLMLSSGVYFEFIELTRFHSEHYEVLSLDQIREGVDYVMLITTYSGLARYVQGDVIRFETIWPFRIRVVGRIGEFINAFGEDVTKTQVEDALVKVCEKQGVTVHEYTVAPRYLSLTTNGYHEWLIEFVQHPKDIELFQQELDKELQSCNTNYAQKRIGSIAITALKVRPLPKGSFDNYYQSQRRQGGQSKIQRLRNDRILAEQILCANNLD